MSLTINDYIVAASSTSRIHIAKIELLDQNYNVTEEISSDIISGDLTLTNQVGCRRNATIVLKNETGKYIPAYRGSIWLHKKVRIYSGIRINNEDYFINKGIFVISEVQVNSQFADKYSCFTLLDKWSLLDGTIAGALEVPYIIPANTPVIEAVNKVFLDAGETLPIITANTSEVTPYSIIKESGDNYASILTDLAGMLSWTCFYDKFGMARFEPKTDETTANVRWVFSTDEVTYQGSNHRFKFDSVKNIAVIYGDNIGGHLVTARVQDDYIFSPTRIALIGARPLVITDTIIYNDSLALDRANYELKNAIITQESVDLTAIPVDIIDEDNIIVIRDSSAGLNNDRYLVNSISYPLLSKGSMSINAWKHRPISS